MEKGKQVALVRREGGDGVSFARPLANGVMGGNDRIAVGDGRFSGKSMGTGTAIDLSV